MYIRANLAVKRDAPPRSAAPRPLPLRLGKQGAEMTYVIVATVMIAIVVLWVVRRSRYYGKIFSDSHYAEVAFWAARMIDRHPVKESSMANGTALMTDAGLAIAYTSEINQGDRSIHFSISQAGGYTTGAVGGKFVFLLIRLLNKNKCKANIFKTDSTVHHAVFEMPVSENWILEDLAHVVSDMKGYQPLPITKVSQAQQGDL